MLTEQVAAKSFPSDPRKPVLLPLTEASSFCSSFREALPAVPEAGRGGGDDWMLWENLLGLGEQVRRGGRAY